MGFAKHESTSIHHLTHKKWSEQAAGKTPLESKIEAHSSCRQMCCMNMSRKLPLHASLACWVFLSFQYQTKFINSVESRVEGFFSWLYYAFYHIILISAHNVNIMTYLDLCHMTPSVIETAVFPPHLLPATVVCAHFHPVMCYCFN